MIYRWILELTVTKHDVPRDAMPEAKTWRELTRADIASLDFRSLDPTLRTEVEFGQDDPEPDALIDDLD